jgi:cellulose synthase/poly-beta-1,6-N-acetylglucosamine synthase-like glycosyltransferase
VISLILFWLAQLTALVLLAFSLRRAVLLFAACLPKAPTHSHTHTPTLLILIPCRNEAESLPGLFDALDQLDYARDKLQVVIVDDGSTDRTAHVAQTLIATRPWARLISLPTNVGKAQALNAALAYLTSHPGALRHPSPLSWPKGQERGEGLGVGGEVVIYDADHRPAPNSLRALVAPLADPQVAAVSGQMRVVNGRVSPAAFYAMIESHVNQLVTMRAKDRLNLAPALLGANCAYRLSALEAVGGFRPGALLEDSDLTLAFALAGWRTRFAADSISTHHAPATVRGYLQQHLRWNRGFHQVTRGRLGALLQNPKLSLLLKLELLFFSLGYADRLALLAGAFFTLVDLLRPGAFNFPSLVWAIYFGLPALEMLAALVIAREPLGMFLRLTYVPFFFVLDIGIALWSNAQTILQKPFVWSVAERPLTAKDAKSAKKPF